MAHLYDCIYKQNKYFDKAMCGNYDEWKNAVINSRTVYVGNLSIYTQREHIKQHMEKAGVIDRIIMGLNRIEKTPCGFCFVVYKLKKAAMHAVNILDGTILDSRIIRVDEDLGFIGSRRYGRGKTGVQKADERSNVYDEERPAALSRDFMNNDISNKRFKANNYERDSMKGYVNENDVIYQESNKQRSGHFHKMGNRIHQNQSTYNNHNNNYMNYTKNKRNHKIERPQNKRYQNNYNNMKSGNRKNYNMNNSFGDNKFVRKTIHKKRYQNTQNFTLKPKGLYNTVNIKERHHVGQASTLYPNDQNIHTVKNTNVYRGGNIDQERSTHSYTNNMNEISENGD